MKVLIYSRVFPPAVGGMERFAADLAEWLARKGHLVTVATYTPSSSAGDAAQPYQILRCPAPHQLIRAIRKSDVTHVSGLSLKGILPALLWLRRPVVTHHSHQAICATGLAWSVSAECGANGRPGPCEACPQRSLGGWGGVQVHRGSTRLVASNVCVSAYLERRLGLDRSRVVYNPVSQRWFLSRGDGSGQFILFSGRLVSEKGVDLLLRALVHVPGVHLKVAGEGPCRLELEQLAQDLRLSPRVSFLGAISVNELIELYARAALICVPSRWGEPFGYVAAEAMAMNRPVVAAPSGALVELLSDGRGFLAEDATEEALGATLVRALSDEMARNAVTQKARVFADAELHIDSIGPKYEAAYMDAAS